MPTSLRSQLGGVLVCAMWLLAGAEARADEPGARIISTNTWLAADRQVIVQSAYEISAPAREWYGLYTLIRLDRG